MLFRGLGAVVDRGHLRDAHAGDDAGGADGAGADPHLDAIGARFDQRLGSLGGGHVAGDDLQLREGVLDADQGVDDVSGMAVRGIEHHHVDPDLDQLLHMVEAAVHPDGRAGSQAAEIVLGREGIFFHLLDILDGDQALEMVFVIHHQELFDAVLVEERLGLLQGDSRFGGDQMLAGHHIPHQEIFVGDETEVAVGDDSDQLLAAQHRHAGDAVAAHDFVDFAHGLIFVHRDRVDDHARLGFLDLLHLADLLFHAHVLVDDADAALPGHGDGGPVFGHRIHGGTDQGDVQGDGPGQAGGQAHLVGQNLRGCRHQKQIVKGIGMFDFF